MPSLPRSVCPEPGCPALTHGGRCPLHLKDRSAVAAYDRRRGSAAQRGYGAQWQRLTRLWREEDPMRAFCVECLKDGLHRLGPITDHVIPHKGDQQLFWDTSNWQALCKKCHDSKTAREEGGFGNPRRAG